MLGKQNQPSDMKVTLKLHAKKLLILEHVSVKSEKPTAIK